MSGTRAPEVQQEIEQNAAFEQGYEMGLGLGIRAKMTAISNFNLAQGLGSSVHLSVTYLVGVWYLELEDASSRKVTMAHEDLGVALEGIFR